MFLLSNPVRHYAWGSPTVLPELLGVPPTGEPWAELWIGAHPSGPSVAVHDGLRQPLSELVHRRPEQLLGRTCVERFGPRLPFLLKVLAVAAPLSIQAHPGSERARAGFDREEEAGLPVDHPLRSYRDPWAKPELVCALSPLEVLVGFRPVSEARALLVELDCPALADTVAALEGTGGVVAAVAQLLRSDPARRAALAAEVPAGCARLVATGSPHAGDLVAVGDLAAAHPGDLGVTVALLLRRLVLQPGDAVYVPDGAPHAYLHGTAVEMQASSDNTLRGGLTPKHVDVGELVEVLDPGIGPLPTLPPQTPAPGVRTWAPAPELQLSRVELAARLVLPAGGPQLLLCTEGAAALSGRHGELTLRRGQSAFLPADGGDVVLDGAGLVFHAAVAGTGPPRPVRSVGAGTTTSGVVVGPGAPGTTTLDGGQRG